MRSSFRSLSPTAHPTPMPHLLRALSEWLLVGYAPYYHRKPQTALPPLAKTNMIYQSSQGKS